MLEQAQVGLIDDLHRLGRQLGVLKRIYQSYELILTRLLKRQRRLREEKRNSEAALSNLVGTMARADRSQVESWNSLAYDDPAALGGVTLAAAAATRFERLLDRIGLYALSEIDECITEKEALNFLVSRAIFCLLVGKLTTPGLQSYRHEGLPSSRKADSNHDPASKSHHSLPASQPNDSILFN